MVKKVTSLEQTPVDPFEAIKRALIRSRGLVHEAKSNDRAAAKLSVEDKKAEKEPPKPTKTKIQKLTELASHSDEILFTASSVFPFSLFPDTITLDREKLTIAKRFFWRVAQITSSPINDIQSAQVNVGPFFGSINLTSKYFFNNQRTVNFLWRKDATHLSKLLQGYIIAHERDIDCGSISKNKLITLLDHLGHGAID